MGGAWEAVTWARSCRTASVKSWLSPCSTRLLIRGTEEGIDKFIEFLKLIDHKPQQIFIEVQSVVVSQTVAKDFGLQWFYNVGNLSIQPTGFKGSASVTVGYTPAGATNFQATLTYLLSTSQGKVTDAIRIATMNLMTASNTVTTAVSDCDDFLHSQFGHHAGYHHLGELAVHSHQHDDPHHPSH